MLISVTHNIYLNKEQRYALHEGKDVDIVGVSLPVWSVNNAISEPAKEIFCRYYLRNPKEEIPVKLVDDGYVIYIPYRIPKKHRDITNEEWQQMSQEVREIYYMSQPKEMSSHSLLDIKDGGSMALMYKESNKYKLKDEEIKLTHYINVLDMSYLNNSMFTLKDL